VTVSGRFFALAVVIAVLTLPVRVSAASAPPQAPHLMSAASASPVMIHWTPAAEGDDAEEPGHGHGHDDDSDGEDGTLQLVLRADGPCGSAGEVRTVASFTNPAITDFTDPVPDGTYCYSIAVGDDSVMAVSPGLTVVVATRPAAAPSSGVLAQSDPAARDTSAPAAPGKLSLSLARTRAATRARVTLHWTNPEAADLDRVELVMNRKHPPRSRSDGRVVYRGLALTFALTLPAGKAYFALYAIDHSGNISSASRRSVALAALVPLRPLSGSAVHTAPLLRWEPQSGVAYYNLQVFQRGKRVLVAWPHGPSYRFPAGKLQPGTYVWFVWPAFGRLQSSPQFGNLIGRATFAYEP
jgi:hypothetical protein